MIDYMDFNLFSFNLINAILLTTLSDLLFWNWTHLGTLNCRNEVIISALTFFTQ